LPDAVVDNIADKLKPSAIQGRIQEFSIRSLTVQISPGADVLSGQIKHEFLFGTAITQILAKNFNYVIH
jgi:hypothetical protein